MADLDAAAAAVTAFLRAFGLDPEADHDLRGTGERVARAWAEELLSGYGVDVDALLAQNAMPGSTELVVVRDVPVTTMCPHHLLPSSGHATVAFAPADHLVGIGALARVVDALARRLALQEQLGQRVVDVTVRQLAPRWAGCRLVLSHACMTARGPRSAGARLETVAFSGPDAARALAWEALGVGR